jgi:hypothetical protein
MRKANAAACMHNNKTSVKVNTKVILYAYI